MLPCWDVLSILVYLRVEVRLWVTSCKGYLLRRLMICFSLLKPLNKVASADAILLGAAVGAALPPRIMIKGLLPGTPAAGPPGSICAGRFGLILDLGSVVLPIVYNIPGLALAVRHGNGFFVDQGCVLDDLLGLPLSHV